MQVIRSKDEMRLLCRSWHANGDRIVFVPTMGALHEGHLDLLRKGRGLGDKLVLSIYVNPLQFGKNEDLSKYPRDLDGDLAKVKELGVDAVFFPGDEIRYPSGYQTSVDVTDATNGLCGASRPGHFRGVATVVLKLFNIIQPDVAIFGEKDYQQLVVIQTMVRDLNVSVEIVGVPTVREESGLAMSSRNAYLSHDERMEAARLYKGISAAKDACKNGETDAKALLKIAHDIISSSKLIKIDYLKTCDAETLEEVDVVKRPVRILVAAFVGKTRLIDNCHIGV